jgi:hypothetical protein
MFPLHGPDRMRSSCECLTVRFAGPMPRCGERATATSAYPESSATKYALLTKAAETGSPSGLEGPAVDAPIAWPVWKTSAGT